MYALYFVCFGASLLVTYVGHLSLRSWRDHVLQKANETAQTSTEAGSDDCVWTSWTSWSECTVTCGKGVRVRHRTRVQSQDVNVNCSSHDELEAKPCKTHTVCHFDKNFAMPSYQFRFPDSTKDGKRTEGDDVNDDPAVDPASDRVTDFIRQYVESHGKQTYDPDEPQPEQLRKQPGDDNEAKADSDAGGFRNDEERNTWRRHSFCSSFDCSTPDTPPGGPSGNLWSKYFEQVNEKDGSKNEKPDGAETGESADEGDGGPNERTKSEEKEEQNSERTHARRSFDSSRKDDSTNVGDDSASDELGDSASDEDHKWKNEGFDDEDDDDEDDFDNDDDDEGDGDGFNDDEEDVDSGSGGDERNERGKRRRKRSIPENEEQDDKEEMDEDEADENGDGKARKRRPRTKYKRKRKRKKKKVPTATLR